MSYTNQYRHLFVGQRRIIEITVYSCQHSWQWCMGPTGWPTYTIRTFRLSIKCISLRNTWRTAGQIWVFLCECLLQCNDETRQWRQWLRTFHIVTHATVWILISYTYHHGITYTNVKIHSFMFHCKDLCYNSNSLNLLIFVMNNRNGSTYIGIVHQYFQCIDIRPETNNARLFLPHTQIITFDWMWIITWLFEQETVCVGWDNYVT